MQGYHQQPAYQPHQPGHPGMDPNVGRSPQLHGGVAQFMTGVYAWMSAGIAVTAAVAFGISQSPEISRNFFTEYGMTGLGWAALFGPLAILLLFGRRMVNMSRGGATAVFMVLAVLYGITFSIVPLIYPGATIVKALASTMGMFATMAIFGYVTKKDLTGIGQFLLMAVFGIIIASLVNMFFVQSYTAHLGISVLVVLVFAGLTAYDTQKLKQIYLVHGAVGNIAILGALNLYLDFINMFWALLHLFGSRD